MNKSILLLIILMMIISCQNQKRENESDLNATTKNYHPLLGLIDPRDTLNLKQTDGTGIFNSELSIFYEKYETDSTTIDLILDYMSSYNLDSLNENKFFTSSFDKDYLKISNVKRLKLDIEFFEEIEHLNNAIHVGYYLNEQQYFISFDMTNEIIYSNYQEIKNNAR